ncbi:hypothetical protein IMZ48_29790 [Candidatus Bathyarchaeota archaeon]|nr:hypothetical protein [Candidatus Bathyarchaeota archaeon]
MPSSNTESQLHFLAWFLWVCRSTYVNELTTRKKQRGNEIPGPPCECIDGTSTTYLPPKANLTPDARPSTTLTLDPRP